MSTGEDQTGPLASIEPTPGSLKMDKAAFSPIILIKESPPQVRIKPPLHIQAGPLVSIEQIPKSLKMDKAAFSPFI